MKKSLLYIVKISVLFVTVSCQNVETSHEWDLLIFTQHWPATVCVQYEEGPGVSKLEDGKYCLFPKKKNQWSVHGVWPTKLHTEGPAFCNNSLKFQPALLDPIRPQLSQYWLNIQGGKPETSLWKHEWVKHGTCATSLSSLDNQQKYFEKGLDFYSKFNLTDILSTRGIVPDNEPKYDIEKIYVSVQSNLGKNPQVQCIIEKTSKQPYLFEIRLCFNKELELVDCDGIKGPRRYGTNMEMLTNCPKDKLIVYPSQTHNVVPDSVFSWAPSIVHDTSKWYLNLEFLSSALQCIKFLQWLTL